MGRRTAFRRALTVRAGWLAGALVLAGSTIAACAGPIAPASPRGELAVSDCREAISEAQRGLPFALTKRGLVSATADLAGPLEADPCGEAGARGDLDLVAVVWMTYPGPAGSESWPVGVFRRAAGGPIEVIKPFPLSILDPRSAPPSAPGS